MKLLLASLVFILFSTLASAQSGWRYIGPVESEIQAMAVHEDLILCVASTIGGDRLFRSTDAGQTWDTLASGVRKMVIIPDGNPTIVGSVPPNKDFMFSTDLGETWDTSATAPPGIWLNRMYIKSGTPNLIFAVSGYGAFGELERLYRSSDYGRTWSWPYPFPASSDGSRIAVGVSPTTPDVYVNVDTDIGGAYFFHSSDVGVTWENVGWGPGLLPMMVIDPIDPLLIYAPFQSDFVRSTDGGLSWSPLFQGWRGIGVVHALMSPENPDHLIFLAQWDSPGVYQSKDRGATWVYDTLSADLPYKATTGGPYEWLNYDAKGDRLYLESAKGIYVREDVPTIDVKTTSTLPGFSMLAWPQPASENLTVKTEFPIHPSATLRVYNTLGMMVREWHVVSSGSVHWDLRNRNNLEVPNGVYLLTAIAGKEVVTTRVVIQR
jgi:hypothetical protein